MRVDRAGGFTGLSAPRVTLRRRRGALAWVPAREPGGSSRDDAGVRGFLEPSHVGDGVGGSSAASGPPRPRGVFGDSTAASDLGFFSLDGSLMSVRYQMPCPGVPTLCVTTTNLAKRLPLSVSAVAPSKAGFGRAGSRSVSRRLGQLNTSTPDIAHFVRRSALPRPSFLPG